MSSNLTNQSSFLYEANWTPALDSLLLRTMIKLKLAISWDGTVFPNPFILEAKAVMEHELGYTFEWSDLYDRLHFLEKRYKTFKVLVQMDGTYWEVHANTIIVDEREWVEMMKRNPLVGAYYHHDDPAHHELAELFALHNVKVEEEKMVIILSDSIDSNNNMGEELSCNQSTPVGCKLSFNEGFPSSVESTNKKPPVYYITGADGKLQKKDENVLPSRPIQQNNLHRIGPNISNSAASSSPII
ncbi:hypothetical protein AAHA92_21260 [Salvia divinorum]|uniref:Myb/SANT-like domain-containing protein n=1 Tax=Salvia divinorum TaxID=28513 RepID=A0ABD1GMX9_SALDI